uniref:Predicted RNA binding protein YcfA, dsRBD-like fold, HicA-like mRNA interferase family n=2 Tax=Candidatus Kentrum sp. LPFa TaxID=2126335 RepID=A0A450W7L4_9GAMM|nr:MAG: Predicted RNA binding protein YcfA, dsRBD-like fold, HicA-like mRNA interferase family [Candidatus Kentron sp. LPFa]
MDARSDPPYAGTFFICWGDETLNMIVKMLQDDGWYLDRTKGSHRQFRHSTKAGLVTVPGKPNNELAFGTQNSIYVSEK